MNHSHLICDYQTAPNAYIWILDMIASTEPIDVVIAWVDGSDPDLNKKRIGYLNPKQKKTVPGADSTRFNSLNEISYCVLSIFKFAPFVRNIFIVTDNQNPNVHDVVKKYYPTRVSDIRIVDHTEIFKGYENHLPTFNSICISNMLWAIKGLSNQFVYFNDDIFLVRPLNPSVWFQNNRPVLRGKWVFPPYERLLWEGLKSFFYKTFLRKKNERAASFQVNQWNAALLQGFKFRYFRSGHTPLALDKKRIRDYFMTNPEILEENIKHRFRKFSQFNTVALANHLEYVSGNRNLASSQAVYAQPKSHKKNYIEKKFNQFESDKRVLFLCIQSLDLASKSDQNKVFNNLNRILEVQI